MHFTRNFHQGTLFSLITLSLSPLTVNAGAIQHRQNVNIDVCFQVPLWAYESPEVRTFCTFVNSMGLGSTSTATATVTRIITVSSTSTSVIPRTVTTTTTTTSTPTQTQFSFFTPVTTVTETDGTTTASTCPPTDTPVLGKRNESDNVEMLPNMPGSLRNLGLALPEIENLCFCVINRFGPSRTTTRTVTVSTTTTRVAGRTVTSTTTSMSTFTAIRTDVFTTTTITAPTSTETVTVTACTTCLPDGAPCNTFQPQECCGQRCVDQVQTCTSDPE